MRVERSLSSAQEIGLGCFMQAILNALARALHGTASLFIVLALVFTAALSWGVWAGWGLVLYGLLIGLLWSLLLLCLVWWFQPPTPNTELMTSLWRRLQAQTQLGLAALKVWIFVLIILGVSGLTFRFSWLWWQQIPF